MKKKDGFIKEIAIDTGSGLVGAGIGLVVAGPPGALIGGATAPILSDVLKRFLSKKEKSRIERVAELANILIQKQINSGSKPTENAKNKKIGELFEGTLLTAKDEYEDKKIPLLANLFARAPFTNTPINNLIQSLILADQLSYRQLGVLSVIGRNQWENCFNLSPKPLPYSTTGRGTPDEKTQGIYEDVNYLLVLGLIGQVFVKGARPAVASGTHFIAPVNLILLYPGMLLFNGMLLDEVEKESTDEIVKALKWEPEK